MAGMMNKTNRNMSKMALEKMAESRDGQKKNA